MIRALAVTVSNRASAGVYEDRSGPVLVELLRSAGCDVVDGPLVVPDGEPVEQALRDSVAAGYDVAVTTGGTGLTPTDQTPEMTRRVIDREVPGIAEALRAAGAAAGRPVGHLVPRPGRHRVADPDRQPARVVRAASGTGWTCSGRSWCTPSTRSAAATTSGRHRSPDQPRGRISTAWWIEHGPCA